MILPSSGPSRSLGLIPGGQTILDQYLPYLHWAAPLFSSLAASGKGSSLDFASFTRNSAAYYLSPSTGFMVNDNAINTPRFENFGLRMEGQRSNLLADCSDYTRSSWIKTNMTTLANASVDPRGVFSAAVKLTATATNATVKQTIVSALNTHTYSVWLKRLTGTGAVSISVDGTTFSIVTLSSTDWTLFQKTTNSLATIIPTIRIGTSGDEIYAWTSNAEIGSFGSSVNSSDNASTRSPELLALLSSNIPATKGTLFVTGNIVGFPASGDNTILDSRSGGLNGSRIIVGPTGIITAEIYTNSLEAQISSGVGAIVAGTPFVAALAYQTDDVELFLNGASVGTDTSATMPTHGSMNFGTDSTGGSPLFGHIKDLRFFDQRFPASVVAELS